MPVTGAKLHPIANTGWYVHDWVLDQLEQGSCALARTLAHPYDTRDLPPASIDALTSSIHNTIRTLAARQDPGAPFCANDLLSQSLWLHCNSRNGQELPVGDGRSQSE